MEAIVACHLYRAAPEWLANSRGYFYGILGAVAQPIIYTSKFDKCEQTTSIAVVKRRSLTRARAWACTGVPACGRRDYKYA